MAVKNVTTWQAPNGSGYFSATGGATLTTLLGSPLTTLSLVTLTTDPYVYIPKYTAAWTNSSKNKTAWAGGNGQGYVVTVGNQLFVTNSGNFLVTNSGNNIVTTPTYIHSKNTANWTASGA
jgi:hypothetical protein